MKNILLGLSIGIFAFGCGFGPSTGSADEQAEIIDNLIQAGFPENDIMVFEGVVYVGRDAAVSLEASREMLEVGSLAAGIAVSVPALQGLANPDPAAALDPAHPHCASFNLYHRYLGHSCVGDRMIGRYEARCKVDGDLCYRWTDDEGPCELPCADANC